jgi:hypothetical protein
LADCDTLLRGCLLFLAAHLLIFAALPARPVLHLEIVSALLASRAGESRRRAGKKQDSAK